MNRQPVKTRLTRVKGASMNPTAARHPDPTADGMAFDLIMQSQEAP